MLRPASYASSEPPSDRPATRSALDAGPRCPPQRPTWGRSSRSVSVASAKAGACQRRAGARPEFASIPSQPSDVETKAFPMAIASSTFSRVPPPTRKGRRRPPPGGRTVGCRDIPGDDCPGIALGQHDQFRGGSCPTAKKRTSGCRARIQARLVARKCMTASRFANMFMPPV